MLLMRAVEIVKELEGGDTKKAKPGTGAVLNLLNGRALSNNSNTKERSN